MRQISVLFIICLLNSSKLSSQISIFVDNTYQHEILSDSLSGKKTIVNQKTYNVKGTKLLFEINYDSETALEKNIIAYFYDSLDRMTFKEMQTINRKPIDLSQIVYNENGDTSVIKIYKPVGDTVAVSETKYFYYDDLKRLNEVRAFDNQEKPVERQVYSYKKKSLDPASKTVYRYDPGPCKQKHIYTFTDTASLLKKIRVSDGCNTASNKKYSVVYEYNQRNKIISEKTVLKGKNILRKRIYEYKNDTDLSTFYDVNNKNKITAFYSRTYFWHKVSYLNVKSYFE
ncbi:MAG: hypothetical protein JW723_07820 [Bacteroidales bacterium]|nr:hypothetical protein [Bacteroidales bacterium]